MKWIAIAHRLLESFASCVLWFDSNKPAEVVCWACGKNTHKTFFGLHSEMKLQWTVCKSKAFFMQWNFKGFSNNRPTSTSTLVQLWPTEPRCKLAVPPEANILFAPLFEWRWMRGKCLPMVILHVWPCPNDCEASHNLDFVAQDWQMPSVNVWIIPV